MTRETNDLDGTDRASTTDAPANRTKVDQLKKAIELGEYSIEAKLIADKIIAHGALSDLN